jgi:hypothetical protein
VGIALDRTTWIGLGIMLGLALSAVGVVVLVVALGAPILLGLAVLAVLDVAIIVWGYVAVQRSLRAETTGSS